MLWRAGRPSRGGVRKACGEPPGRKRKRNSDRSGARSRIGARYSGTGSEQKAPDRRRTSGDAGRIQKVDRRGKAPCCVAASTRDERVSTWRKCGQVRKAKDTAPASRKPASRPETLGDHHPPSTETTTQESGLRENRTSRLSERTEEGRKPDLLRLYSGEAGEQRRATVRATVRGVGGAKGGGRGERGPGPHAPGSGPGKRVKGTGPRTARCTTEKEGTVHRAPPPCHPRPAPDGLLRPQATSCPRRGWADVAGLRSGPRSPDRELARAGPPGSVPGAARPPRVHPQGGRQPALAGHRGAGGQDRPTGHGGSAERDLRGGLPRVLVWLPARARGARRARCARGRDHPHQGEPHLGRRHPVVLRRRWLMPLSRSRRSGV